MSSSYLFQKSSFCDIGKDRLALIRIYRVLLYHHKYSAYLLNEIRTVHYIATTVHPKYYYHGKIK
jgi:hypothetical protein